MNYFENFYRSALSFNIRIRTYFSNVGSPIKKRGFFHFENDNYLIQEIRELIELGEYAQKELEYKFPMNSLNVDVIHKVQELQTIINDPFYSQIENGQKVHFYAEGFIDTIDKFIKWCDQNYQFDKSGIKSNIKVQRDENFILSDTPFIQQEHLDIFLCLNKNWNIQDKKKWTYIYNFMTDSFKIGVSQNNFFTFVSKNFEVVARRKQETANDGKLIDSLQNIYDKHCCKE